MDEVRIAGRSLDRIEMLDVVRRLRPDLTELQFDAIWHELLAKQRERERLRALH